MFLTYRAAKNNWLHFPMKWMSSRIPGNGCCNIESNQELSKYQLLGFRDTKQQKIFHYVFQVVYTAVWISEGN